MMIHTNNYTNTTRLTFKDIESLLTTISECTAKRYYSDIKTQYGIKIVLYCHFKEYFKIN